MADFERLCKLIIDTNGDPSVDSVLDCGYTMEHFIRIAQQNVSSEKLVYNAREALRARGIRYKECN